MSSRPLSDRRHQPPPPDNRYEVRVWDPGRVPDGGWRTLACCAEHEDAVEVASSAVAAPSGRFEYSEVWGPGATAETSRRVYGRYPPPSREEQQELWLRAADENYAASYSDLPQ